MILDGSQESSVKIKTYVGSGLRTSEIIFQLAARFVYENY